MQAVANVPIPYVQTFRDRHGKVRYYFRRAGAKRVALPGAAGSREFNLAYERALEALPRPIGAERVKAETVAALLVHCYASAWFRRLDPVTRVNYANVLDRWRQNNGDVSVRSIQAEDVDALMASMSDRPSAAKVLRKRLAQLFDFAVALKWRPDNPFRTAKAPKTVVQGFRDWPEDIIAKFEQAYPAGSRERLALYLLLYTAQRRSDVTTMGRQHRRGDTIMVTQFKGRNRAAGPTRLTIRLHPALRAELDALPKDGLTYLVTEYGLPFTHAGFTAWFVERAKRAGIVGYTPHGLRKAAARRLAEAGCSAHQIMAITGHKSLSEVEHYTKAAGQVRLAEAAMDALEAHGTGTGLSNPFAVGCQPY